eukprot:scaffold66802_cov45-Phaeocystis_antarctica.AAC.1
MYDARLFVQGCAAHLKEAARAMAAYRAELTQVIGAVQCMCNVHAMHMRRYTHMVAAMPMQCLCNAYAQVMAQYGVTDEAALLSGQQTRF